MQRTDRNVCTTLPTKVGQTFVSGMAVIAGQCNVQTGMSVLPCQPKSARHSRLAKAVTRGDATYRQECLYYLANQSRPDIRVWHGCDCGPMQRTDRNVC